MHINIYIYVCDWNVGYTKTTGCGTVVVVVVLCQCWKITTPQEIPNWGHSGCWSKLKYESIANSLGGRPWSNGAGWLRRHPICHVSWCSNPLESWFSLMLGDLLIFNSNSYIMDFSGYFFRGVQGVDSWRVVWVLITYSAIRVMFSDNHDHPSFIECGGSTRNQADIGWQLANSSFWFCTQAGPGRGPPPWFMFCMIGVPNSVYSLQPLQPALATTRRDPWCSARRWTQWVNHLRERRCASDRPGWTLNLDLWARQCVDANPIYNQSIFSLKKNTALKKIKSKMNRNHGSYFRGPS